MIAAQTMLIHLASLFNLQPVSWRLPAEQYCQIVIADPGYSAQSRRAQLMENIVPYETHYVKAICIVP